MGMLSGEENSIEAELLRGLVTLDRMARDYSDMRGVHVLLFGCGGFR